VNNPNDPNPANENEYPNEYPTSPLETRREGVPFDAIKPHLIELRKRLQRAMASVLGGVVVGLFLVLGPVQLVNVIITAFTTVKPNYPPLQAVGTAEVFTNYMMVAFASGVVIAMPMIVYQVLAFLIPGTEERERKIIYKALPFITGFFIAGIAFGWFVTVPVAIRFLMSFGDSALIANQPALSSFLRTVTLLLIINGVVFQLPIIIYVMALLGITTAHDLGRYRHYAFLIITIVAAIVTPTGDPINLLLLAIPMYLLFEFGVFIARFVPQDEE
jgi:sec-independent protein translocase protein TatC